MKLGNIVITSFFVSFFFIFMALFLKITHSQSVGIFLIIGILASAIFIASAIYEVRASIYIDTSEKTRWAFFLLFFSGLAGLIYIVFARKRITNT